MQFNDVVDVFRAELVTDAFGSHRSWDSPRRIASVPAIVLPSSSTEANDPDREAYEVTVNVYVRPADVKHTDRVRISGAWYEVQGPPITWRGRTASYMRITARRIDA
ncbi:head-tail adaptor protein [Streptosporangium sp. NPDC020072]|uniref:phage head completion protein n=1 Tax=Streptosporangium sp. NPDC020072 TaxID=3154788 RepID=UPI003420CEE6